MLANHHRVRLIIAIAMVVFFGGGLSACSQQSSAVGDRLWGDITLAHKPGDGSGNAPRVRLPASMAHDVTTPAYNKDGFEGTRIAFSALPIGQFNQLGTALSEAYPSSSIDIQMTVRRTGDTVSLRASADLTDLSKESDLVTITVQFGGPVSTTTGKQTANDTAQWSPTPGSTSTFTVDADYADPSTSRFSEWTWIVVAITVAAAAIVGAIAFLLRDTSARVATPTTTGN